MDKLELSISQSKSHVFWRKDYIPPNEGQSLITQTLRFEQNRVRVTLHPTYMYLQEPVVNDFLPCYIEDKKIQEAGVYIMQSKINPESKYFKIKEAYENFELQIAELGIKHDCIEECSICCSDLFYVSENEALYLLAQVLKMGNIRNLAEVYHKAKRQAAFLKENDDYVHKLVFCNWTSQSKEFYNFGESYTTQEPCPFLDAHGKCIGYSARPNICRLYGTRFACRISGSKDRTGIERILLPNGILADQGAAYVKQYRPLFYFILQMLHPSQIWATIRQVQEFLSLPEEEYFAKQDKKEWFMLNETL